MSFIDKIFPNPLPGIDEIEQKYKRRNLTEGAKVTRVAPSPTGFMHIGGIYAGLINERLAHQSNGVFFLRIEDTDTKREVEGATELICSSLAHYGITADEGFDENGNEIGSYAPYKQSERKEIYQAYIKQMLSDGRAYPCFATQEELDELEELDMNDLITSGNETLQVSKDGNEISLKDESGRNVSLTKTSDGGYEFTDEEGNKHKFDKDMNPM